MKPKEFIQIGEEELMFVEKRFESDKGHPLPSSTKQGRRVIDQEWIYTNNGGTLIGVHPDHPSQQ